MRDLVACELFAGVITYHSYSQLILYPWGYAENPVPDVGDRQLMTSLAIGMQGLIAGVHGVNYVPQQSSELYPTAGDTTDWTYGIPSFTIELRPRTIEEGALSCRPARFSRHGRRTARPPSASSSSSPPHRWDDSWLIPASR